MGSHDFPELLTETADRVTVALDALLPRSSGPEARLISAMRYAALGPGKRMRPFLTLSSAAMLGASERSALRLACALECVHAYSLIHDDLPCMDNDDMRRGRPTVHIEYDEATAVLAGDALQSIAFEILAAPETHDSGEVRAELVRALALAAGARGMAGGQMIDMAAPDEERNHIGVITRLQRMKTGALIAYAVEAPGYLVGAGDDVTKALEGYAHDLGLVYQIVDDLLDVEGDASLTGKAVGKDDGQGKATFVSILGVDGARERARHLADQAKAHLSVFGESAAPLNAAVDFVLDRKA
ncbi:MAG: polyprenyl synthetase family protein [Pseudomonadota bacterium]